MIITETKRLRLRVIHTDDAAFYLALVNQPSWIQNISDKGIRTLEQAEAAIRDGALTLQAQQGFSFYVVEELGSQTALGLCGLIKRDSLDDVDLGYAFLDEHAGHGYAHEAAQAVVHYAQHSLQLARLAAITSPDNHRSQRLLAKLGFQLQGDITMPNETRPTLLYSLNLAAPL
jgi:RimJ/RimL family protein N-acetyltransferase